MIIKKTAIAAEEDKLPTKYDLMNVAYTRGMIQTDGDMRNFRNTIAGVNGENKMIELIKKYGQDHWIVLRNTWLNYSGSFECDIILITSHCVYLLEVKNFIGKLIYENGVCNLNDWEIPSNPIHQTRRGLRSLRNIFLPHIKNLNVQAALVLIGERNQVDIKDTVQDISVLQLTDIYNFIEMIKAEENMQQYYPINVDEIIQVLERYETENPFKPTPFTPEQIQLSKKGIHCIRCNSYNINIQKHIVVCKCGLNESREQAIIRTACEYGVLCHDQEYFTVNEIREFLGLQATTVYTRSLLLKHFNRMADQYVIKLYNPKLPFSKCYSHFNFEKPMMFYSKERCPMRFIQDCLG